MVAPAAPQPIRLLLVDDHIVVRQGLRLLLANHPDLIVVGDVSTTEEALDIVRREPLDLILLDLFLGDRSGFDLLPRVSAIAPDVRVLVLTGIRDKEQHRRAIHAGASGVVLKDEAVELVVKAIRRVHAGEIWVDRNTTALVLQELRDGRASRPLDLDAARRASLTIREREVVGLVAEGLGTRKIADALFISEKTVRNHLASIYDKLQLSDRLELALYAAKHGLTRARSSPN